MSEIGPKTVELGHTGTKEFMVRASVAWQPGQSEINRRESKKKKLLNKKLIRA